ncbi:hypothetical protein [Photorhabdus sp. SF281]|uniref:hypothetical protein n=1 Tax=Photorhabdus sp. SF281 TaxID=3459527 RepID=UPI004044B0F1
MNTTDLKKLILNSGFTLKELLKINRNFIILYKDDPDVYDKHQSKTDCFCQHLLFIAEEIALPIVLLTSVYSFIILGIFFSEKIYSISLMLFIYFLLFRFLSTIASPLAVI